MMNELLQKVKEVLESTDPGNTLIDRVDEPFLLRERTVQELRITMLDSAPVRLARNWTTPRVLHGTEVGPRGKTGYVWRCEGMVYTKSQVRYVNL
jgi:hypothetical protein